MMKSKNWEEARDNFNTQQYATAIKIFAFGKIVVCHRFTQINALYFNSWRSV
jgi:hypothetical protein